MISKNLKFDIHSMNQKLFHIFKNRTLFKRGSYLVAGSRGARRGVECRTGGPRPSTTLSVPNSVLPLKTLQLQKVRKLRHFYSYD